jgi:hypothetical protein
VWTTQRVLDAAAAMEWMPAGAIELRTEDYRLIRYPDAVLDPTLRAAQVTWSRTTRPLGEVIDEIAVHARGWGVPGVAWWISAATEPAGTEEALRARDAELIDAAQILAREHGATLALVKGRKLTSGPTLLRAGFADYGEERCYWLPVS